MTLSDHQKIFAMDVALLIQFITKSGHACTLGEAYRTPEQAAIYAKEGKGIKDSLHCQRLAIDLNLFNAAGDYLKDAAAYEDIGFYWESMDKINRWGGRFPTKDANHFERNAKI